MPKQAFLFWTGIALAAGGVLTFLINVGLTPLLRPDAPFAETAASSLFLWRQGLSALTVLLLLFGAVGLYLRQSEGSGWLGAIAFIVAFAGGVLAFALEWAQTFLVHDLALRVPDALARLDTDGGPGLYDLAAMIAVSTFALGWLLLAIVTLRSGLFSRRAPILVIAGFFAIPLLTAALGTWGAILGNAVLGSGWLLLGTELSQVNQDRPAGISQ